MIDSRIHTTTVIPVRMSSWVYGSSTPNSEPMNDWSVFTTTSTAAPMSSSGMMSKILLSTENTVARTIRGRWRPACTHSWRSGGADESGTELVSGSSIR